MDEGGAAWESYWAGRERARVTPMDECIYGRLSAAVDFAGRDVVELGCGRGVLSYLALARGRARSVTLVDASPSALALARELFSGHEDQVILQESDIFAVGGTYDIVMSSGVIEHFCGTKLGPAPDWRALQEVVSLHAALSRSEVAIVVPARGLLADLATRRPWFIEQWGHQLNLAPGELLALLDTAGVRNARAEKFLGTYAKTVKALFPVSGRATWRPLLRAGDYADVLLTRTVGRYFDRNESRYGGLIVASGTVARAGADPAAQVSAGAADHP